MDTKPDQRWDDLEEELGGGIEDLDNAGTDDEVSYDELAAALGKPLPKWFTPAAIGASVLVVALLIFFNSAAIMENLNRRFGGNKSVAEDLIADAEIEAGEPGTAVESQVNATLVDSIALGRAAEGDALEMSMVIPDYDDEDFEYNESLYNLLNAVVSPYETAALSDTAFYDLVFSPLDESVEPIALYRDRLFDQPETLSEAARVGMGVVRAEMDSMKTLINEYELLVTRLRKDSLKFVRQSQRMEVARDSAKQSEIKKLAKIIDTMSPASAASMLAGRSSAELEEVLFRLKPRVAAKILQNMSPSKRGSLAARIVRK